MARDEVDELQDEAQKDMGEAWDKTKDASRKSWEAAEEEVSDIGSSTSEEETRDEM